ncbi:GNAT family N-acetyltransferase [Kribbella turkmenica]|uniref:GNAT family N-acetyltransferase n=1 Tax=Kribbella turkmenica TaxID=2530375 RepID=A0A4R4WEE9_9ACTN|nr:GNAT family N-acetyltransferase [Kribbella turkmenica]TDD16631.1 GNAT family N-acetyltransferase [Kribbella turkmenica]
MSITLTPLTDPDFRPFSRRIAWLATDADGNPVGSAFLRLNGRQSQAHLAELELNVHPAERRRGIGSQLLGAVVAAARDHEVRMVLADARVGSPADLFLEHHGFGVGSTLIYARLPLAGADPVVEESPGYRLVSWAGVVPDEWAQTFTDARAGMNDAPTGDIAYGEDPWDVERTRHAGRVIEERGEHLTTVAAVDPAGTIVGFTELVVPGDGNGDAQHYGTAVLPDHRGHGLALWMKVEQIRQARVRFPDLAGLLTDTVSTNTPMQRVNHRLGYRPTHTDNRRTLDICTY